MLGSGRGFFICSRNDLRLLHLAPSVPFVARVCAAGAAVRFEEQFATLSHAVVALLQSSLTFVRLHFLIRRYQFLSLVPRSLLYFNRFVQEHVFIIVVNIFKFGLRGRCLQSFGRVEQFLVIAVVQ